MDQSYEFFLALHLYSLYASGFLMLFYLILTQGNFKTEFIFIRRIRLFFTNLLFIFSFDYFYRLFVISNETISNECQYLGNDFFLDLNFCLSNFSLCLF